MRVGKFSIPKKLIHNSPADARKILNDIIVVRAEYMYHNDSIEYVGVSDHFDDISENVITPQYEFVLEEDIGIWTRYEPYTSSIRVCTGRSMD